MPAIPKPASTVVLMDELDRIYLTKRPETMKFLGGYFVFPGGAVDSGDRQHDSMFMNLGTCEETFSPAYYVAAARELFEEVGVFLGGAKDSTQPFFKKRPDQEYRHLLVNGEMSLLDLLKVEGLYLNLMSLRYFGHFITPEQSPIRFDTRFFLAKLPAGQTPKPDKQEVADAFWASPEEALAAYKEKRIPLAPPTIASLHGISRYLKGEPLQMPSIQDFIR